MRVCLIDPIEGGHHYSYLELYLVSLVELGFSVTVLSPTPKRIRGLIDREEILKTADVGAEQFSFVPSKPVILKKFSRAVSTLALWRSTAQRLKEIELRGLRFDVIFFLWLDCYLAPFLSHRLIDAIFPYPWVGLYFHPTHLRRRTAFARLDRGVLRPDRPLDAINCKAVAILDEGLEGKLAERFPNAAVISLPDVANTELADKSEGTFAKKIRERAKDRTVIVLLGSLHKRKGLLELIEISRFCDERLFFVIVGKVYAGFSQSEADSIKSFCQDSENTLCYLDWVENERDFNSIIASSDVVWAAYTDFYHSSNIVTKAAFFYKPAIVHPGTCSEERINKYGIGICIDPGDTTTSASKINSLVQDVAIEKIVQEGGFERYRSTHNKVELCRKLIKLLPGGARSNRTPQ